MVFLLIENGGSKFSAVASVGASVLCPEVSTGHPHPRPTTVSRMGGGFYFYHIKSKGYDGLNRSLFVYLFKIYLIG